MIDVEQTYSDWLTKIESSYFILRPDFYLAATASSAVDVSQQFDRVLTKLELIS